MTITDPAIPTETPAGADPIDEAATEALVEKLFGAVLGAQEVQAAFLGDRLGFYEAIAAGPLTSTELAAATETSERYAREWLEHQTVAGYLRCHNAEAPIETRRFEMPAAHVPVLADPENLAYVLPLARFQAGVGKNLDALAEAFRTDGGVSWLSHGPDAREAQAAANRPMFIHQLGPEYLASIPAVHAALSAGGRVADIGAGFGWSAIGIANTYTDATVDIIDIDEPSVEAAARNIAEAGLADRVRARCADAAVVAETETYDLVLALECVHDMGDPVSVLAAMRRLAGEDGTVIVMDERVGDHFTGEADEVEQFMYGFSITCCLADCKCHPESVETGTVMRSSTLEAYAREAGFGGVEILPIENDFFRFYELA